MKFFLKLTFAIIFCSFVFSSCKKGSELGKMIPKNALIVTHINSKSLLDKLSLDEIKQTYWYKQLYSDSSAPVWAKSLIDDPSKTGVDVKGGFIIFYQKPAGTNGEVVCEGDVTDTKAFEAFNKNLDPAATSSKDGDLSLLTLKNNTVVAWNSKKFAYIFNPPSVNYSGAYNPANSITKPNETSQQLATQCKSFFNLTSDNNMEKVDRFTDMMKEDGDIHFWQNTEQIMTSSAELGALSMLKLDALYKGNVSTITANFESGKISVKQKMFAGKELTDLLKKYGGGKINTDLIKNIPSQNVAGVLALHFQPEGIKEIIKLIGMDGMANMGLSQAGITIDDFVKANKGDVLLAVTDLAVTKDSSGEKENTKAEVLFAVTIGDKPSFDKLMNAGKKMSENFPQEKIAYANNDKIFVVGSDQSLVSKYLAGNNNSFPFTDKIKDYPIALFIDLKNILGAASNYKISDSTAEALLSQSVKMWDNVYSMGGEFKDDAFTGTTEINLIDKNTNSLKQLNTYFDSIAKVMIEKEKKSKSESDVPTIDTTTMMAPSDTTAIQAH